MSMTPDELEELEYLQGLSDEELEAEMAPAEEDYRLMMREMEPDHRYHFRLSTTLDLLVTLRRALRTAPDEDRELISTTFQRMQRELWNLRLERQTGFVSTAAVN